MPAEEFAMNPQNISEVEKLNYEKEFSDFLIERINQAGGSLSFQTLPSTLHQLRYEIREAIGTTKLQLRKFLKTHQKTFNVDSRGVVTLVVKDIDSDIECNSYSNIKPRIKLPSKIQNGTGKVVKIFSDFGIIEANEPFKASIHFTPASVEDAEKDSLFCNLDLEVGTIVCFNAVYGYECEIQYRASKVWVKDKPKKKKKAISNDDFDKNIDFRESKSEKIINSTKYSARPKCSQTKSKEDAVKVKLENEKGYIYSYSHGAVIKFGKNESQVADGNSSQYFLYGNKVSDIAYEFSHGTEIFFDAVKIDEAPGWKAVLAWVGEKPKNSMKYLEECEEIEVHSLTSETDVSSRSLSANKNDPSLDCSVRMKNIKLPIKSKQNNLGNSISNVQNKPFKKYKNKQRIQKPAAKLSESANFDYDDNYIHPQKKSLTKNFMERNQDSSEDDEFHFTKLTQNSMKHKSSSKNLTSFEINNSSDEEINNDKVSLEKPKISNTEVKANIKKYNSIEGKIVHVFCKMAEVESAHLQRNVQFVLNSFYLNEKSVEEQDIVDLKEIIQIGDTIKFNCYEILDDDGEIYQRVTMAWKGPKPTVSEMTAEEFMADLDLPVSSYSYNNLDTGCVQETIEQNLTEDENTFDCNSQTNSYHSLDDTLDNANDFLANENDMSEDDIFERPSELDKKNDSNVNCKVISDIIIEKLKTNGYFSSGSEGDLCDVIKGIANLVLKTSCVADCSSAPLNQEGTFERKTTNPSEVLCSVCSKKSNMLTGKVSVNAEVQTISTGEIEARSIYPDTY